MFVHKILFKYIEGRTKVAIISFVTNDIDSKPTLQQIYFPIRINFDVKLWQILTIYTNAQPGFFVVLYSDDILLMSLNVTGL